MPVLFFFFVSKNSIPSKMVQLEWQNALVKSDLPPRAIPHPMLVPAPVEGREGRASSGTRATA